MSQDEMIEDEPSELLIQVETIHNLRDVGGLVTTDGRRVRPGVVFRSAQLGEENDHTLGQLRELDLDVVFDLRSDHEAEVLPDFVPEGVQLVRKDVLADSTERIAAQLEDAFTDPVGVSDVLLSGVVQEHYTKTYRNLVALPSARQSYAELFTTIAQGRSILFHCTAGKDRTGWAAAALQLLLGVPEPAVMDHYLASNPHSLELFDGVLSAFAEAGGDRAAAEPVFMVEPAYLRASLDEVAAGFGSVENYFIEGLELDATVVDTLRGTLIQG